MNPIRPSRWIAPATGLAALLFAAAETLAAAPPTSLDLGLELTPAWTADGNQLGPEFGRSASTAGDVDGDGYSDVLVGSRRHDNGAGPFGAAFVYRGGPGGLAATPAWSAFGDSTSQGFGYAAACAGDVNGDGFDDVIVSAFFHTNRSGDFLGRAFVFHGSAAGLSATPAWTVEGDQINAWFGGTVATAGDVNGDGFDDVLVGAHGHDNGHLDEGRAFLYLGSAAGLAALPAWTAESNQTNANFGISAATAGDVNADGYTDVIVGAPGWTNGQGNEGRAYVYPGSAGGLLATPVWTFEPNVASASVGQSVAGAGDVNGDGYADVLVGAPLFTNTHANEGRAYLFSGSAAGPAAAPAWTAQPSQVGARFGSSVMTAGDVNGDGFADVIVGAPEFTGGLVGEGRAFVYLGAGAGLSFSSAWTAESDQASAHFGLPVATAGDVNGDGRSDVLVAAREYSDDQPFEGRVFVYHGETAGLALTPGWAHVPGQPGAQFGSAVAGAGDLNGDGYSDLIVAAPGYDDGQFDEGIAKVRMGSPGGPFIPEQFSLQSNQQSAFLGFGTGVAHAGDVNGDGFGDVLVGIPFFDGGQTDEGRIHVNIGAPGGLNIPVWAFAEANLPGAFFGYSVSSAGDVNGDGHADILVGAYGSTNGETGEGRAYCYHGSPTGIALAWTAEPDQAGAQFGYAVASAGDVNGDGYSDVIVGAPRAANGQLEEGRAFVYLGSASGLAALPAWSAESNQVGAEFGSAVAGAGDVNGDGYSDVIIGAQFYDGGAGNEGRAEIYLGSPAGPAATPAWSAESNLVIAGVSMSVASAGDVNGDGYSDVIVGYRQYSNGQTNEGAAFVWHGGPGGPDLTPDWSAESDQASANFGSAVAGTGDVNGDGFGDVIVGAQLYDSGASNEGLARVYYGNLGDGLDRIPRSARSNVATPIALLGRSDLEDVFRVNFRGRTPAGRGRVRIEHETKSLGTPFAGPLETVRGPLVDTGAPGTGGSTIALSVLANSLAPDTPTRWRARLGSDSPFFPHSPWFSPAGNAPSETDLRSGTPAPRFLKALPDTLEEGDSGPSVLTFTVTVTPAPLVPIMVDYATVDGSATVADGDYDAVAGTLTFDPGVTSHPVEVTIHGDTRYEFDETITLTLSNPQGATLANSGASGVILADGDASTLALCPGFPVTDGQVEAIVIENGVAYLGGGFTQIGPSTGSGIPLDPASGAVLATPRIEGDVFAVVSDGAGGFYVGGAFTEVAGQPRANLAHLGADFLPTAWNPGTTGVVRALALAGGVVYAGGDFHNAGGQVRHGLAAFDAGTGAVAPWSPSSDGPIRALVVYGSTVYVGGDFSTAGGGLQRNFAALDIVTGSARSWDTEADGPVHALVAHDGSIYAGGSFFLLGGEPRVSIAEFDTATAAPTAWNPEGGQIRAMAVGAGVLYVGGIFSMVGGAPRASIAALDLATGLATAWNPGTNFSVDALAVNGATVYAGGRFTQIGGQPHRRLAALDAVTGLATAWQPRPFDAVNALAFDGVTVFAGGLFDGAGGLPRNRLAAVELASGSVTAWNPDASGEVRTLVAGGGLIYAGGFFTQVGGAARARLAALDPTTGVATAWDPGADQYVDAIHVDGGTIYVGGAFFNCGGQSRLRIAALDATTGAATPWNPGANLHVEAIAVAGGYVYAGGHFTTISGLSRSKLAAIDPVTGEPTAFSVDADDAVFSLVSAGDRLYVGGAFTSLESEPRAFAGAIDPVTGEVAPWDPDASGLIHALAAAGDAMYAGGLFPTIGDQPVARLATLDTDAGFALPWIPAPDGDVRAIAVDAGRVIVGGVFDAIAGRQRSYLACLGGAPGTVDVPDAPAPGVAGEVALRLAPNPALGVARIEYTLARSGPVTVRIFDVRGRHVATPVDGHQPAGHHVALWDGAGRSGAVGAGIYFIRLETAGKTRTDRLVRLR